MEIRNGDVKIVSDILVIAASEPNIRRLLHSEPTKGFAELWVDGVPQTLSNGQSRKYLATAKAGTRSYLKAGAYRDPAHTATTVIYNDNILVGNSYAAVHP